MSENYEHPRVADEKSKVKYLHSQLKKTSIDISLTELYNIWSRCHGSKDWKEHVAKLLMPTLPPMPELQRDLWSVTTVDISGFPTVTLAYGADDAISAFLHNTFIFVHLLPDANFRVVGEDDDAALSGLHLIEMGDGDSTSTCLLSLTKPACIELQEGIKGYQCQGEPEFAKIGSELDATVAYYNGRLKESDRTPFIKSHIAFRFFKPMSQAILEGAPPRHHIDVERMNILWRIMKQIRLWINFKAKIV